MNPALWPEILENKIEANRIHLLGAGVVCGLRIFVEGKTSCSIHLTAGTALTSRGYLINICQNQVFKYYRAYEPKEDYFFFRSKNPNKPLKIWELLQRHEEDPENARPLAPQTMAARTAQLSFTDNKIVLLFLEPMPVAKSAEKKPYTEPTFKIVNKGDKKEEKELAQVDFQVRVLLMEQEDVFKILATTDEVLESLAKKNLELPPYAYEDKLYNTKLLSEDLLRKAHNPALRLSEICLRRPFFGVVHTDCQPGEPDWEFPKIETLPQLFDGYVPIINEAVLALEKELTYLKNTFGPLLMHQSEAFLEKFLAKLDKKWALYRETAAANGLQYYIQYFYDWVHDLIRAYNELRLELLQLNARCCPNTGAYPQHVLLGLARRRVSEDVLDSPLRHTLSQAPIYNLQADGVLKVRLYFMRICMMINSFYLPDYLSDPDLNPSCQKDDDEDPYLPRMEEIRVTPSPFYHQPLGDWAVPYYYPLDTSIYSIQHFWNFFRAKHASTDHTLSYYATSLHPADDPYTRHECVVNPLIHNFDSYPFFRIEGHIGKKKEEVYQRLLFLKGTYNLAFDIELLPLKELTQYDEGTQKNYFNSKWWGLEHLAGVKEAGTFLLVFDEKDRVVADFSLPYRCCKPGLKSPFPFPPPAPEPEKPQKDPKKKRTQPKENTNKPNDY